MIFVHFFSPAYDVKEKMQNYTCRGKRQTCDRGCNLISCGKQKFYLYLAFNSRFSGPNPCEAEFPGPDCKVLGTSGMYTENSTRGEEDLGFISA